jgi:integrase
MGYPLGPLFRLLLLTGQRKSEAAEAVWSEFDLAGKIWTIPPDRMKADAAHVVPLSADAIELLEGLPRFKRGGHLFSSTYGATPVNGFSKAKNRVDQLMLDEARALAVARGDDPAGVKLDEWRIHDIRRTMRTGLSALPGVSDMVRELVIAHTRPGLHKVYDQFSYIDEKRAALELWAMRLRGIVAPRHHSTDNVVSIAAAWG